MSLFTLRATDVWCISTVFPCQTLFFFFNEVSNRTQNDLFKQNGCSQIFSESEEKSSCHWLSDGWERSLEEQNPKRGRVCHGRDRGAWWEAQWGLSPVWPPFSTPSGELQSSTCALRASLTSDHTQEGYVRGFDLQLIWSLLLNVSLKWWALQQPSFFF